MLQGRPYSKLEAWVAGICLLQRLSEVNCLTGKVQEPHLNESSTETQLNCSQPLHVGGFPMLQERLHSKGKRVTVKHQIPSPATGQGQAVAAALNCRCRCKCLDADVV